MGRSGSAAGKLRLEDKRARPAPPLPVFSYWPPPGVVFVVVVPVLSVDVVSGPLLGVVPAALPLALPLLPPLLPAA